MTAEFIEKNPRATVPLLELDDGTCIFDTLAICDYLESLYPEVPLIGRDAPQRARILMWHARIVEDGFTAVAESFRNFVRGFRHNALTGPVGYPQIPELVERGRARAVHFLKDLDRHLSGRRYIVDDVFTLADISALATVDFARAIKLEISAEQTSLRRWYDLVSARPSAKL